MQTPIPSSGTPVQLTLLSWPERTPEGGGGGKKREGKNGNLGSLMEPITSLKSCDCRVSSLTNFLSLQGVPDVTVEVVVAGEDKAAGVRERQRRDAGVQAAVLVANDLLVGA